MSRSTGGGATARVTGRAFFFLVTTFGAYWNLFGLRQTSNL